MKIEENKIKIQSRKNEVEKEKYNGNGRYCRFKKERYTHFKKIRV